jgi:glycosyltransferase involved in cell wall biosynthesis
MSTVPYDVPVPVRAEVPVPRQVVVGDPRHGVVRYARQLRGAVASALAWRPDHDPGDPTGPVPVEAVHVHFTDKLFGGTPQAAADRFRELATRHAVTVTLHDLPQASDGRHHAARGRAYAAVAEHARAIVCNSHHEVSLLRESTGEATPAHVIPLPLVGGVRPWTRPADAPAAVVEAAVLGFYYPGKGHDDVAEALLSLADDPRPRRLTVLGAASSGHDAELDELVRRCRARGLQVDVTGYLSDEQLTERVRTSGVPVVAHQHVSASGSLNSWISGGRRPLVRDNRYSREMEALRPHTLTRYPVGGLAEALRAAADDPGSTWLGDDAVLSPGLPDVAAAYLDWWREDVPW